LLNLAAPLNNSVTLVFESLVGLLELRCDVLRNRQRQFIVLHRVAGDLHIGTTHTLEEIRYLGRFLDGCVEGISEAIEEPLMSRAKLAVAVEVQKLLKTQKGEAPTRTSALQLGQHTS
jgi:hypothetical protein